MTARPNSHTITLTNMLGKTITIRRKADNEWLVTQQKIAGKGPRPGHNYDYTQAPTWLKSDNRGGKQDITILRPGAHLL